MGRYLLYFSYIGTSYRGLQRQLVSGVLKENMPTVQSTLDEALQKLNPVNEVSIVSSSRTDAGVNAISNTAHVDLQHRMPNTEFSPLLVTAVVNHRLAQEKHSIRVLQTRLVPDSFHARFNAVARHYVYRFNILRDPQIEIFWASPISVFEVERSALVVESLDTNRLHEVAKVFSGTRNFQAYTNPRVAQASHINPVKTVSVGVKRGQLFVEPLQDAMRQSMEPWEIHVSSGSFLFRMVRRIVGVILQYASGKITMEDVLSTFDRPSQQLCRLVDQRSAPAYGLYLRSVEYNPADLEYIPSPDTQFDVDISSLKPKGRKWRTNCLKFGLPNPLESVDSHMVLHSTEDCSREDSSAEDSTCSTEDFSTEDSSTEDCHGSIEDSSAEDCSTQQSGEPVR